MDPLNNNQNQTPGVNLPGSQGVEANNASSAANTSSPEPQPMTSPSTAASQPPLSPAAVSSQPVAGATIDSNVPTASSTAGQPGSTQIPSEVQVHTMPGKFMPSSTGSSRPMSGKKMIVIIAIVAFALAGVAFGAYYYLNAPSPEDTTVINVVNTNNNQSNTNEANQNVNEATVNQSNTNINTAVGEQEARDKQRVIDVLKIARALDIYYTQERTYPQFIAALPTEILPEPPRDPLTSRVYIYGPQDNRQSYVIIFDIEKSADFNGELLTKGSYELTPDQAVRLSGEEDPEDKPDQPAGNIDSDGDGLTAAEELLFRTSAFDTDTDDDGYLDGAEISNFYSPIRVGNIKLDGAGQVKKHEDITFSYSFFYPSSWSVRSSAEDEREVIVAAPSGEEFQLRIVENSENKTAWEWYSENISFDFNPEHVVIESIDGRDVVRSIDGMGAYTVFGDTIYAMEYHKNSVETVNYPNVFELFVRRLQFTS